MFSQLPVIFEACRPKQWIKNLLVIVAPLMAKSLFSSKVLVNTCLIFLSMCFVASSTYIINDLRDAPADAKHPTKSKRPIASRRISSEVAIRACGVFLVFGFLFSYAVSLKLASIVMIYFVTTTAYSLYLKRIPIVEMVIVAFGFVLRAYVGAVAVNVNMSIPFLISVAVGAIFVIVRKRYAELTSQNERTTYSRISLNYYSRSGLAVLSRFLGIVFVANYLLWGFMAKDLGISKMIFRVLSAVPLSAAVIRYELVSANQSGESPEDLLTEDRKLVGLGLLWLGLVACGNYSW